MNRFGLRWWWVAVCLIGGLPSIAAGEENPAADPAPPPRTSIFVINEPVPEEEEGDEEGDEEGRWGWYVVPNLAYSSDDSLGFGARGELQQILPGYEPYRVAYVVHLFGSINGYQHHRFRYDRTGFGPDGRLRVTMHLAWRSWQNDKYFGVGNATRREPDASEQRYNYSLLQPFLHTTLRIRLGEEWRAFCALAVRYSVIETYAGSLLAEEQPFGMDGGLTLELHGGLLYDSRQPEVDPRRGMLLELSGRFAPGIPEVGTSTFGGVFAQARGYRQLKPWAVLAGRVAFEWLWADTEIPFYEMVHWGGAIPVAGFGGSSTLRGIPFGRWRGPGKAIANLELRLNFIEHTVFNLPFVWQLVPFVDVGLVMGTADVLDTTYLMAPLHPGAGLGIHVVFDRSFVGRVDLALGIDPVRRADGYSDAEPNLGIYVVFDNAF